MGGLEQGGHRWGISRRFPRHGTNETLSVCLSVCLSSRRICSVGCGFCTEASEKYYMAKNVYMRVDEYTYGVQSVRYGFLCGISNLKPTKVWTTGRLLCEYKFTEAWRKDNGTRVCVLHAFSPFQRANNLFTDYVTSRLKLYKYVSISYIGN